MDATTIAALWPLANPSAPEPLGGGINNRTFRLHADSGDYILRLYPSSAREAKIAFEVDVLKALSRAALPFQVPAPLAARTGELVPTVSFAEESARALMVPVIPGAVRQPDSLDQAFAVGAALGALVKAMAGILPKVAPPAGNYGELELVDPNLPDPLAAAKLPLIGAEEQGRVARLLEAVMAEREAWYRRLPQQIIHGDYVPFNLLMEGDRVTAVLDFELACHDIRTLDYAIGLWPWLRWEQVNNWASFDAFTRGYTSEQPLTASEVEALPFLLRLRRAGTIVWWVGRYLQGTAPESSVHWAVESALAFEDWLEAHGKELVERASKWVTTTPR